jgi:hypothetical protein
MHRLIIFLMIFSLSFPTLADTLDIGGQRITGLSQTQIAVFAAQAAKMAEENGKEGSSRIPTAEQVIKYSELGRAIGTGLASAAKELGIAVNEFADTSVGKIAMVIIVMKLIGFAILRSIIGLVYVVSGVSLWIYFFRRMCLISAKVIEYDDKGKKHRRVEYIDKPTDTIIHTRVTMMFVLAIIIGSGVLIMFI